MGFSADLDRYLTSPPEDDYSPWVELVYESFTDSFYDNIGSFENSETEDKWLSKLHFKDMGPKESASIIERAYSLYIK